MDLGLNQRRVLVTGCSGGIGQATAIQFAAEGARVAVHYNRNAEAATALAEQIGGLVVQADLRDEQSVNSMFDQIVATWGGLDACVVNAGVYPDGPAPVVSASLSRWLETIESNLTSAFLTTRGFLRALDGVSDPSLVLVGSAAGSFGEAGHSEYSASKSALHGFALSVKNEIVDLAPLGRVNVVSPGWTLTPMAADVLDVAMLDSIFATRPMKVVATPEDIARTIVAVSSRAFGHVSGQVVLAAGGQEGRLLASAPAEVGAE